MAILADWLWQRGGIDPISAAMRNALSFHAGEEKGPMVLSAISSPCTKVCKMDERTGLCLGCGRTLAEIGAWGTMSEDERRRVMAGLSQRRVEAVRRLAMAQQQQQ